MRNEHRICLLERQPGPAGNLRPVYRQGIKTVYGGVTIPNEKSEKLHLSFGSMRLGTCRNNGYKCGKWHNVAWFEKEIVPYMPEPAPFIPVNKIPGEILERAVKEKGTA